MAANLSRSPLSTHTPEAPRVAIVGAGPVGLALALGLSRHGVRCIVLEKKPGTSERSKAPAIHTRTREILRQWGVEERFLDEGRLNRTVEIRAVRGERVLARLDFRALDAEADRPAIMVLEQGRTEALLLEAVRAARIGSVRFGAEVTAIEPGPDGVTLTVRRGGTPPEGTGDGGAAGGAAEEETLEADYVVACDGAGSFVRGALGMDFEGKTYALRPMLGDVRVEDGRDGLRWPRLHNGRRGLTVGIRLEPGTWRIIRIDRDSPAGDGVPDDEVAARARQVLGPGPVETLWASRFRIHRRSVRRFRAGRVLLAGDAAHLHSPLGGQGMNAGIQDAHNLAWKLAQAVRGGDVDALLDSYDVERRAAVVGSVSRYTDVLTRAFLQTPRPLRRLAFVALRAALTVPRVRARTLRRGAMLDLHYSDSPILDADAPHAGERLPNPVLATPDGTGLRLYDLLPAEAVAMAVNVPPDSPEEVPAGLHTLRIGPGGLAEPAGILRRLVPGGSGWILVRPDAHIAWTGDRVGGLARAARPALGGTW